MNGAATPGHYAPDPIGPPDHHAAVRAPVLLNPAFRHVAERTERSTPTLGAMTVASSQETLLRPRQQRLPSLSGSGHIRQEQRILASRSLCLVRGDRLPCADNSYTWSKAIDDVGEFFFSSPINNSTSPRTAPAPTTTSAIAWSSMEPTTPPWIQPTPHG